MSWSRIVKMVDCSFCSGIHNRRVLEPTSSNENQTRSSDSLELCHHDEYNARDVQLKRRLESRLSSHAESGSGSMPKENMIVFDYLS